MSLASSNQNCIQEEFYKEINFQVDLANRLDKVELYIGLADGCNETFLAFRNGLNNLYNSICKLMDNEIFLLNFKTNQVKYFIKSKLSLLKEEFFFWMDYKIYYIKS